MVYDKSETDDVEVKELLRILKDNNMLKEESTKKTLAVIKRVKK